MAQTICVPSPEAGQGQADLPWDPGTAHCAKGLVGQGAEKRPQWEPGRKCTEHEPSSRCRQGLEGDRDGGKGRAKARDPAVGLEQAVQGDCNLEKQERESGEAVGRDGAIT